MFSSDVIKFVSLIASGLVLFFFLVNNINLLSSLDAQGGRLQTNLNSNRDTLNTLVITQNSELDREVREEERAGQIESIEDGKQLDILDFNLDEKINPTTR